MKQLVIFIALSFVLGSTIGIPVPQSKEVQVVDSNSETGIIKVDNDYLHEVENKAAPPRRLCKVSIL